MRLIDKLLLIILLVSVPGFASTWYVAPSGSGVSCTSTAPCSLDQGINSAASAGDTVLANPGIYAFGASFENWSNSGTSGSPITLQCQTVRGCFVTSTRTGNVFVMEMTGSFQTLLGFDISNVSASIPNSNQGLLIVGSNDTVLSNNVHDIQPDCTQGGGGIVFNSADANTIVDGNSVYNIGNNNPACNASTATGEAGILAFTNAAGTVIVNNIVYNVQGGVGISFGTGASNAVTISNNLTFNNKGGGILLNGATGTSIITNNDAFYNGVAPSNQQMCGIQQTNSTVTNFTIGHNDLYGNVGGTYCGLNDNAGTTTVGTTTGSGLNYLQNTALFTSFVPSVNVTPTSCSTTFTGNFSAGNWDCAIYSNANSAPNNLLCNSGDGGAVGGTVTNNISGCGVLTAGTEYWLGINTDNGGNAIGSNGTTGLSYYTTETYGTWANPAGALGGSVPTTYTAWITGTSGGSSISVNPAAGTTFVNWQLNGSGNYHEVTGSPTVGGGAASGAPNHDYDGNPRPINNVFDIGPYQYGFKTWTLVSHQHNSNCTGNGTNAICSVTVPTTNSNHLLVVVFAGNPLPQPAPQIVSVSGGSCLWNHCPNCFASGSSTGGTLDMAYTLNSLPGDSTITVTVSPVPTSTWAIEVLDYAFTGAVIALDTSGSGVTASTTTPTGVPLNPSSATDVIVQAIDANNNVTAINGQYNTPADFFQIGTTGLFVGITGWVNVGTLSPQTPTWATTTANVDNISAIAFTAAGNPTSAVIIPRRIVMF